jgi:hypothetical protein
MPNNIEPNDLVDDSGKGEEFPKVTKPLSPMTTIQDS